MFADAIEQAMGYVRPIKTISRVYKSDEVIPKTATMFFVNNEGVAVTSRHVAEEIMRAAKMNARYESFRKERAAIPPECNTRIEINRMERRYDYTKGGTRIQLRYHFPGCYEKIAKLGIEMHTFYDLALIRLTGKGNALYKGFSLFPDSKTKPRIGMSLCRVGFPITEFDDYTFSREKDDILWTPAGNHTVTAFPSDGMLMRISKSDEMKVNSFEISGLVGEGFSGAPVFDRDGVLLGMVTGTVTREIDGNPVVYTECVSAEVIKTFLREKNVRIYEA